MYLKILKTNDILLAAKNGEIHTNDDCWIIPEIAHPPIEKIPDEILKRINTPEQFEELIKNTRFYLQDSEFLFGTLYFSFMDVKFDDSVYIDIISQFFGKYS